MKSPRGCASRFWWRTAARQLSGRGCAVRAAGDFAHPLREALKVLVAEGCCATKPRRGCFVAEVTERDLDEIFPVIALLEGRAAHEATQKASSADVARSKPCTSACSNAPAKAASPTTTP